MTGDGRQKNIGPIKRFLLVMFTLQIIIFVGAFFLYFAIGTTVVRQEKEKQAELLFNIIVKEFESTISIAETDLIGWAEKYENGIYDKDSCTIPFTKHLDFNSAYLNYGVVDKDGYYVCSKIPYPKDYNLYEKIVNYETFVERRDFGVTNLGFTVDDKPRIGAGYRLLDKNGEFAGAVTISIGLEEINQLINDLNLPEDSQLLITDAGGVAEVIYPPDNSNLGKSQFPAEKFSLILSQQEGSIVLLDDDGEKRYYVFKPLQLDEDEQIESFMIYGLNIGTESTSWSETSSTISQVLFILTLMVQSVVILKVFTFKPQHKY